MGCTEPIAIAYAAAKAKEILGCMPARAEVGVSGNIVKNAKSVVVPHRADCAAYARRWPQGWSRAMQTGSCRLFQAYLRGNIKKSAALPKIFPPK